MKKIVLGAAAALLLAACSGGEEKANGFITENVPPPASAETGDDGVPRDDYGRPYQYAMLGEPVPEFEITGQTGETLTRDDLLGKWTVLEVWGIWCPDCVADGPNVQALFEELETDDTVDFLAVHAPTSPERADEAFGKYGSVDAYFAANGYSYTYAIDDDASFKTSLNLPWVPSYLLIDPEGVIRGYRSEMSAVEGDAVSGFVTDINQVIAAR